MNIEDFKKLTPQEALQAAGKFAGVDASVFDGIWNAESARGKAMVSPAGARGHFGLMPKTQALFEKKLGVKINPDDFHDSLFVAMNHLADDLKREGGNLVSALRAYNNGPKWREQKDPRGENKDYALRVLGANGVTEEAGDVAVTAPAPTFGPLTMDSVSGNLPVKGKPSLVGAKTTEALASAGFLGDLSINPQAVDPSTLLQASADANLARQQEIDDSTVIDRAQAAFMTQGITQRVIKYAVRPDYPPVDNYVVPEDMLAGRPADDQSYLLEARSPQEAERLAWELDNEKEDQRKLSLKGGWHAFAASVIAGAPEAFVTGVGTAKLLAAGGLGSAAAAQSGNAGLAIGLNALENVGGNLAASAIEDAMGGRMSVFDYAAGAVGGMVFSGLAARGLSKEAGAAAQQALARKILDEAAAKQAEFAAQAAKNLGDGATAAELAKEIERLEAAAVKREYGTSTAGDDRQLLPDMEKLEAQEMEVEIASNKMMAAETAKMESDANQPAQGPVMSPLIGNIGMMSPWNRLSDADLDVRAKTLQQDIQHSNTRLTPYGLTIDKMEAMPPQLLVFNADKRHAGLVKTAEWLHKNFLSDRKLILDFSPAGGALGDHTRLAFKTTVIRIADNASSTLIHEVGHAVLQARFANMPANVQAAMVKFHRDWVNRVKGLDEPKKPVPAGDKAPFPDRMGPALERWLPVSEPGNPSAPGAIRMGQPYTPGDFSLFDALAKAVDSQGHPVKPGADSLANAKNYWTNFDELGAEQFVKWMEATVRGDNKWKPTSIPQELVEWVKDLWDSFVKLFTKAKEAGYLNADESFQDFFERARKINKGNVTKAKREAAGLDPNRDYSQDPVSMAMDKAMAAPPIDIETKYGLDMMPQATPLQRAEKKAMVALYARADDVTAPWNNIDPKWLDSLTAKSNSLGSTGLLMLRSQNPVVRMVASELLESTTGAGGRRTTASITKYMNERKYLGNTINEFQDAYKVWRNAQGGSIWEDYSGGKYWADFNKKVAMEMEARRQGVTVESAPAVRKAADVVEQAYERMRIDQIDKKTVGWANLPASSKGYMPHRISSETVRNMTQAQHRAWHSALVDQFVTNEGWDISFSSNLAAKYIDRAKVRAMGGHEIPANVHHIGAADVVQDALQAMGMSREEIRAQMAKFMRGGAGHTKSRLNLDLLQEFDDNGTKFTLMDLFETDQLTLVRSQAQRVSGETALAKFGVMGKPGMDLLRRAMADFGEDAGKTQPGEIQAFDQVAAEFLGQPFGDYGGKWMNRAMQTNSLARLGGMGFTQFAEYINLATTLGVTKAFSAISGLPRLRAEAAKLARGEKVDNPILSSIETFGGAEFGTDAYKMVFPFDNPSLQYQVNGHETMHLADRLLRGGMHAQGKLSFWRAIHSAQQRGVAEQIVHKAMRMVRDGGDSNALADMGITPQLADELRVDLPNIAKFDGAGRLQEFDITKTENRKAAEAFVQAVHRGTGQIIQGTFIGETGKWAHSGWLRLLTQFRTFSLTSVEKQWARNRNNHGVATALGMLMGSMAMAAPIYMARQVVNSIGRPDQEEWLDKQLSPEKVARATLNYVAASGLAGDFLDAFAAVSGMVESTGGRSGGTTEFVGTVIAPAAGLADDLWRGIQNSKDGTDVHELIKNAPFAKLPWLAPVINLIDE